MKESLYDYCIRCERPELLEEWLGEKNGELTPENVSYGSRRKVWWRCSHGHEWQSIIFTRTSGNSGCPYCGRKKPWPGENDLLSQMPDLAAQWHPEKNQDLLPSQVSVGSSRQVWWKCEKGHEWKARVKSRTNGVGCPVCTNRSVFDGDNDLSSTHPTLALQWHPTKNGNLRPQQVVAGTRRKVWWKCELGHEWRAEINSRTRGSGCPVCAGKVILPGENDLASAYPQLAEQWVQERNGKLTPHQVSVYSNRRVWWRCERGHEWRGAVSARTSSSSGCPYCSGKSVLKGFNDLASLEPAIAAQWHPELNGNLKPDMVTTGSHKKVWWICPEDHVWKAAIYSRTCDRKHGCPVCAGCYKRSKLLHIPDFDNKYL